MVRKRNTSFEDRFGRGLRHIRFCLQPLTSNHSTLHELRPDTLYEYQIAFALVLTSTNFYSSALQYQYDLLLLEYHKQILIATFL